MSTTLRGCSVCGPKGLPRFAVRRAPRPRLRGFNHLRGFSLLELVIVIAIVGVMIAVALPELKTFNQTYPIRNSADEIANLISLARMRASANFSRVQVSCSTTTNQCTLQSKAYGATTWVADQNKEAVNLSNGVSFGLPSGVTAGAGGQSAIAPYQGSQAQSISSAMIFNSRGLPIADNANGSAVTDYALYLVGPNNKSMAITADGSGKSYVYTLNGTAWQLVTN